MFLFCLVFAMSLCASVYMCFVVTCWERADLLGLVCGVYCEFVTFLLVSWVRCGTWLYRFLIFAPLLTLKNSERNSQINSDYMMPKCIPHIEYWNVLMHFIFFNHPSSLECFNCFLNSLRQIFKTKVSFDAYVTEWTVVSKANQSA